jgi:hypothetical protein
LTKKNCLNFQEAKNKLGANLDREELRSMKAGRRKKKKALFPQGEVSLRAADFPLILK